MALKNLIYVLALICMSMIFPNNAWPHDMACKGMCPKILAPVCGQDNTGNMKTFANDCLFEYENCNNRNAGWHIIANTDCEQLKTNEKLSDDCLKICPAFYAPVCGVDNTGNMKNFPNKCMLETAQCENRAAGWKVLSAGNCQLLNSAIATCPKPCTREYVPVCGTDQYGNKKTFGNKCMFENEQCQNRDAGWKLLNKGECDTVYGDNCPTACPLIYAPVCGVDNTGNYNTFANDCMLKSRQCENRAAGWKILASGMCENLLKKTLKEDKCPKPCTREYMPICGQDQSGHMKTFGNKCMFENAQCEDRAAGWKLLHENEC